MIPIRFLVSSLPPSYPRATFSSFVFYAEFAYLSYCISISQLSSNLILGTALSRIRGTHFLFSVFHSCSNDDALFLQVSRHFDVYQTKPEIQAEKVQLIAIVKVPGKYKTHWLHWWNMSKDSRQTYNFPKTPCSIEELRPWTDIAAFWAGVSSLSCLSTSSLHLLLFDIGFLHLCRFMSSLSWRKKLESSTTSLWTRTR